MFLKKYAQNSNVNKNRGRNSNARIKNDYQNRARIPMLERRGPKFQCLKEKGRNTNVGKRKVMKTNN